MLKAMMEEKKKFIPKAGFNVVGVDDFEPPGEKLYLIGNYASEEEAKRRLEVFKKSNPDESAFVYGPDTK